MKKDFFNVEKYICTVNNAEYIIYLFPENNSTGFYIRKQDSGLISLTAELNTKLLQCSVEEFIDNNINKWIEICEDAIEKIEQYYNPNMEI